LEETRAQLLFLTEAIENYHGPRPDRCMEPAIVVVSAARGRIWEDFLEMAADGCEKLAPVCKIPWILSDLQAEEIFSAKVLLAVDSLFADC
jgi:hypothetical protein